MFYLFVLKGLKSGRWDVVEADHLEESILVEAEWDKVTNYAKMLTITCFSIHHI